MSGIFQPGYGPAGAAALGEKHLLKPGGREIFEFFSKVIQLLMVFWIRSRKLSCWSCSKCRSERATQMFSPG